MKKHSIRNVYLFELVMHTFVIICNIILGVFVPIMLSSNANKTGKEMNVFLVVLFFIVVAICGGLSLIRWIKLLMDLRAFKNKDFVSMKGKVLRFKRNSDDTGQVNNKPVVLNLETNEEIVLLLREPRRVPHKLNDDTILHMDDTLAIGGIYTFSYLKHSRIAEVVEKISFNIISFDDETTTVSESE